MDAVWKGCDSLKKWHHNLRLNILAWYYGESAAMMAFLQVLFLKGSKLPVILKKKSLSGHILNILTSLELRY